MTVYFLLVREGKLPTYKMSKQLLYVEIPLTQVVQTLYSFGVGFQDFSKLERDLFSQYYVTGEHVDYREEHFSSYVLFVRELNNVLDRMHNSNSTYSTPSNNKLTRVLSPCGLYDINPNRVTFVLGMEFPSTKDFNECYPTFVDNAIRICENMGWSFDLDGITVSPL